MTRRRSRRCRLPPGRRHDRRSSLTRAPTLPHGAPELLDLFPLVERKQRVHDREDPFDLAKGGAGVERTAEMGMKLAWRFEHGGLGNGAKLATGEIEAGSGQGTPVALGDHPSVESGVQDPNALAEL